MEIHGSSINFSALRLGSQTAGKRDAAPKPIDTESSYEQRHSPSQGISETPAQVEAKLAVAGLSQLSSTTETTNHILDSRKLHAIDAYIRHNDLPLLEQRDQLLVGIDSYV